MRTEVEARQRPAPPRRLHKALLLGFMLGATGCSGEHRPSSETTPRATPAPSTPAASPPAHGPEREAVVGSEWRDPYEVRGPDGAPLIFHVAIHDAETAALDRLQGALAGVHERHASLGPRERLILQNDLWGLIVRLDQGSRSTAATSLLRDTATALLVRLAPHNDDIVADPMPADLAQVLPPLEGWQEVASELPALQHELAFGDRRLFRLFRRPLDDGEELALADHLLAIDDRGLVHRTALIVEVEILRFRGAELVAAEVFELSRTGRPPYTLRPADEVSQIPGLGADSPIAEFEPPEPLSDLPCLRCHHDDSRMSLPNPSMNPRWRDPGVLRRAQASAASVWRRRVRARSDP